MTTRSDAARSIVLAFVVVTAAFAGLAVAPTTPVVAQAAAPPGFVTLPGDAVNRTDVAVDPSGPPTGKLPQQAKAPPGAGGPPGSGPPEWVHDKIPSHALERVLADRHADTLDVQFATAVDGHLAVVLTDDEYHDARRVAIPIEALEDANGYRPLTAYGVHENGTRWQDAITYDAGYAVIEVPGFSTQTVTFDGRISVTGSPAQDGFSTSYDIADLDSVGDFNVEITGATQYENDTDTGTNVSDGGNFSVSVDGTSDPIAHDGTADPTVTLTGVESTTPRSYSGTVNDTSTSEPVTVDGNLDPSNTEINATLTTLWANYSTSSWDLAAGETYDVHKVNFNTDAETTSLTGFPGMNVTEVRVHIDGDGDRCGSMDASDSVTYYIDTGSPDGNYGDGTEIGSINSCGQTTYTFSTSVDLTAASTIHISGVLTSDNDDNEFVEVERFDLKSEPSSVTATTNAGSASNSSFSPGDTITLSPGLNTATSQVDFSWNGGMIDYNIAYDDRTASEDPAIDLGDDGSTEVSHTGVLNQGEAATYDLADVSLSTSTIGVETAGGSTVDVAVDYREVTETVDPSVEINGNYHNYTGTLSDGTTNAFTTNTSWIQEGTNYVNVTVGDGTLTADAPTPSVNLTYNHTAAADKSVTYTSEHFQSRWDVEHTYDSDRSNADLTIPVESEVISIRSAEKEVNSGGLSDLTASDYDLANGEVTVDLGSVSSGDTVRVVLDTSKVEVNNGSITVTSGTPEGSTLASTIDLSSWASDSYISAGGTQSGKAVYYVTSPSWSTTAEYNVFKSDGTHKLYLPNAAASDTFTLNEGNVEVSPQTGDVRIENVEDDASPEWTAKGGPSGEGDDVEYTFVDASSGTTYELADAGGGSQYDTGTAASPVTLVGPDSGSFVIKEATGGAGGGGGGGGLAGASDADQAGVQLPEGLPVPWIVAGLVLLAGLVVVSRTRDPSGVAETASRPVQRIPGIGGILAAVSRGVVSAVLRVVGGLEAATRALVSQVRASPLAMGLVGLTAFIVLLRLGILPAIPSQALTALALVSAPLASRVLMRRLGVESNLVWIAVTVLSAIALLEVLNPGAISDAVGAGITEFFGLFLIAAGALAFLYLRNRGRPDAVIRLPRGDE